MLTNNRYVMILTGVIGGVVYLTAAGNVVRLTQTYALLAVTYLWVTMMVTPVTRFFPKLPHRGQLVKMRRALGLSAWVFALLHWRWALWEELGGLAGVFGLPIRSRLAVMAGSVALIILTILAATATDWAIDKLGFPKWKALHRLVYVAAILVVFHALTLGGHFSDLSGNIPTVFLVAAGILGVCEIVRLVKFLQEKMVG